MRIFLTCVFLNWLEGWKGFYLCGYINKTCRNYAGLGVECIFFTQGEI